MPDASLLNRLLSLFLDTPASIPELAASLNLTVAELLQFTARADVAAMLEQLKSLSALRADVIASASRAQALLALQTPVTTCAIDTPRDRENTRLAASAILRYKPGGAGGDRSPGRQRPRIPRRASSNDETKSAPCSETASPPAASPLDLAVDDVEDASVQSPSKVERSPTDRAAAIDSPRAEPSPTSRRLRGADLNRALKQTLAPQRANTRAPT